MPRGRPELDIAERLRRQMWCEEVLRLNEKSPNKMSLYRLDYLFDLELDEKAGPNLPGKSFAVKTYDKRRRKIFTDLVNKNIMPFKDKVNEFIARVNDYPEFNGTAIYYESSFWKLVDKAPLSLQEIRELIVEILSRYNLFDEKSELDIHNESLKEMLNYLKIYGEHLTIMDFKIHKFKVGLGEIRGKMNFPFDFLALIGALMIENYLIGNLELAQFLENYFDGTRQEEVIKFGWVPKHLIKDFNFLCDKRLIAHYSLSNDLPTEYCSLINPSSNANSVGSALLAKQESFFRKYRAP